MTIQNSLGITGTGHDGVHEKHTQEHTWVLHSTEEVPEQAFTDWSCRQINASQAQREIKSYPQVERVFQIYSSMVNIGTQVTAMLQQGKTASNITTQIKALSSEHIPAGDELQSTILPETCTYALKEFLDF